LENIYNEGYFQGKQADGYGDYLISETIIKKEFKSVIEVIERTLGKTQGKHLLEIGCAMGFFLDLAKEKYICNGIEISEFAANFCISKGLPVFKGQINRKYLEGLDLFDIVVMLDVIEHIPNPKEIFSLLQEFINPGGIIIITTGNIGSLYARISSKYWRLMTPPQHLFFFSKKTITALLESEGFKVLEIQSPWKFVSFGLIFYQFFNRLGIKVKFNFVNRIGIYLNLFDAIRVIAVKEKRGAS
jgi:SAM-dependent methyltransferase